MFFIAYILGFILFGLLMIIAAIAILSFVDRFRYPTLSAKEIAKIQEELKLRLRNPEIKSLEAHFEHPLPEALKKLYSNEDLFLKMDFEIAQNKNASGKNRFYIASFEPADMENLDNAWLGCAKYFCFANDGCGNGYLVNPKLDDPPVMFHDLEEGTIKEICSSLSEFLNWPKFDMFVKE